MRDRTFACVISSTQNLIWITLGLNSRHYGEELASTHKYSHGQYSGSHGNKYKHAVLWDVLPCNVAETVTFQGSLLPPSFKVHHPDGQFLPDYSAQHPRRQPTFKYHIFNPLKARFIFINLHCQHFKKCLL